MCNYCGSYDIETNEIGVLDLQYRCRACGRAWGWAPRHIESVVSPLLNDERREGA